MNKIRLYMEEEQEIFREAYRIILPRDPGLELVAVSSDGLVTRGDREGIRRRLAELSPDVVLLGTRLLHPDTVHGLELVTEFLPDAGVVLLFASYRAEGIQALKRYLKKAVHGGAFLLKSSINTVEELIQVIHTAAEKKVIFDPQIFEGLINNPGNSSLLKDLTPRELEILSLMAQGYKNSAISNILYVELKTVEHYINSILCKLGCEIAENKHPRVQAVLYYLKATGQLCPSSGDLE